MHAPKQISDAELSVFTKKLRKLKSFKGSGTELISLYIPPKTDRSAVMSQLTSELSQSSNIKDPSTRKNVQGALRRIINLLKQIDFRIPETGLAIFCGNVSKQEGKSDIRLFTVVPIKKLETKLYWCDSEFNLKPLEEMIATNEIYGIITIDKSEATVAMLRGKSIEILGRFRSNVSGKERAGGQSARRFERIREEEKVHFFRKVGEAVNRGFLPIVKDVVGIVVAGPGLTKEEFIEKAELDGRIKQKILGTVSTTYTDEYGIREAVERAKHLMRNASIVREREAVNELMYNTIKTGLAVYGQEETLKALEEARLSKLLVSEKINKTAYYLECPNCGNKKVEIIDEEKEQTFICEKCGAEMEIEEERDFIELLIEKAKRYGTEVIVISDETDEGKQFLQTFAGIAGILRYK